MKRILLAVFFYFVLGKTGLLLTLPSGYASPVWPASGFALAFVYIYGPKVLPGIFIGALLVNLNHLIDFSGSQAFGKPFVMGLLLGGGAALQAFLAARFLRFVLGPASLLKNIREVGLFSITAGFLGCCVSPTVGVLSLAAFKVMQIKDFWFYWGTWWVGDTIGVFLFAPLTLILIGKPRVEWRSRLYSVAGPLLAALIVVAFVFVTLYRVENNRVMQLFEQRAESFVQTVKKSVEENFIRLKSLRSFYESSQHVDREEFRKFSTTSLLNSESVMAMEWIPRVSREQVPEFIATAKRDGVENFQLKQRNSDGVWEPAAEREIHYPIYFIEPLEENRAILGFDLASVPHRLHRMEEARDQAAAAITEPLIFDQFPETGFHQSFVIFIPIYRGGNTPDTVEKRRELLEGFVSGAFWVNEIIEGIFKAYPVFSFLEVEMIDPDAKAVMYSNRRSVGPARNPQMSQKVEMNFLSEEWEFSFYAAPGFFVAFRSWLVWGVLLICLLFVSFLQAFLLVVTGQAFEVQRLVDKRTAELRESLQTIEKSKAQLNEQKKMLEKVNKELDGFVYTASHDLRAPLRGISSFASFLEEDYKEKIDAQGKDYLNEIRKGVRQMSELIDDLLSLSRVSRVQNPYEWIPAGVLIQKALERFRFDLEGGKTELVVQEPLPNLYCDVTKMTEVFANLVGNAIKFTSKNAPQNIRIEIGCKQKENENEFFVKDNGIGIAPEYQERIFQAFERLHTQKDYEGTGIGLSIVKKAVEEHGGTVWVESSLGHGAVFYFSIPSPGGEKQ